MNDFADRRVTVMGLGRFGGGLGVTRFLAQRGAQVLVTDTLPAEELAESTAALQDLVDAGRVTLRLGEHRTQDFTDTDLVVVNPAVRPGNAFVEAARSAGVPITSEIRLLVQHLPNRLKTIGVTGSAGKSTTTAMTAHILRAMLGQDGERPRRQDARTPRGSGSRVEASAETAAFEGGGHSGGYSGGGVWMGGNIGGSLLPCVDQILPEDWVVLELSSFMLEGLREDRWSPHIAVITNISPNHLDWHGSMEAYVQAKRAILESQKRDDFFVFGPGVMHYLRPPDDGREGSVADWPNHNGGDVTPFFDGAVRSPLPGPHNLLNARIAVETCGLLGIGLSDLEGYPVETKASKFLADFHGLPHRLQFVGEIDGIRCYDDSKSTTPEAAMLAIESFPGHRVRLILGGYDKGSDFAEAAQFAARTCHGVYTIGATGDAIAKLVEDEVRRTSSGCVVRRFETLDAAVSQAFIDVESGGVLLLSPGCASWDQFANYEERGRRFVELVRAAEQRVQADDMKKPTD